MTPTDWIIDIALILIVLRQVREERLGIRTILLPLGISAYVALSYLGSIPTGGNDLVLLIGCLLGGSALGLAGALLTKVRGADGAAYIRAGFGAAGLWVASMTARLGFIIWITHTGQSDLAHFSVHHQIMGAQVWTDALVLLALSEVVVRVGTIVWRGECAEHVAAAAGHCTSELVTAA